MIVATFNANSIRSRIGIILDWLAEQKPDVLCVQETKVQDVDFPVEAFGDCGYEFVFRGQKKYNGVALFSRYPIEDVEFGLDSEPADEPRMITAFVNDVAIVNTYVPQGTSPDSERFQYKLDWFKRLHRYFESHFSPDEAVLWMGDLNVAMDERDVHNAKTVWGSVCYCQESIDAISDVVEWGFEDMFRKFSDEGGQYTFWDYRVRNGVERNAGWRLDYVMATAAMSAKCRRCWVDKEPRMKERPSDHTFLLAEFDD
ncbi:MAG: exodeoxyribonuclease III [Planctomycetes bacterium]|nr:exodeoxyribonuclease III [Planctomycetota bacterium]